MPPRFNIADVLTSPSGEGFFNGFNVRKHDKGSMICTGEGDENGVFVVMGGRLKVYLVGDEREMTLFYLVPGDIFCMHSGCLIEAVEKSELRFTDIRTFSKKLEQCPAIAFGLVSILGRAIMSCMRTIEDLMFHDIKQRIAWFFVDRASSEGKASGTGITLSVELTIEEIANLIGSSRQTTSTALNSLIKEGYISRKGRTDYTILDMPRLTTAAAGRLPAEEWSSVGKKIRPV
ncbi:CRP-like cAMP-binding protein [Rhodopseudomonas rhenobacensis]|uniref:CRP-like cAMP-binding protein n=1 Tax=Rhodopseudomonas rhenobacensis TaxID=87461 RepID=A0A7W7Z8U9_9BRAD|nr:Crp/Fnr family transcriptional regulator [Rhodopseudomonas rhenobacensis]MBB5049935.1 CRP-like cAMP-binding protein [Rhodopseudomonas rhenobacensis]